MPRRGTKTQDCAGLKPQDQCQRSRESETAPTCSVKHVPSTRLRNETIPRAMERSQPSRFRRTSTLLGQHALVPTPGPEDPSPRVWTQDTSRTVAKTIPHFVSMPPGLRRTPDLSIARTSWEHKLSSHQENCSPLRSRTRVLWCS